MPKGNRQTTMTGISTRELIANELGSNELHRKHVVRMESEDGLFLRARVIDQSLVDRLFIHKRIDADQYDAALAFHALAHRAGVFPSSMQMERVQMSVGNRAPRALAILSVDRYLQRACSARAYRAVWTTIIREIESPIKDLIIGLDALKVYFNPTLKPGSRRAPESVRSTIEQAEKALQAASEGPQPHHDTDR
jgi:hypothetical protein